MTKVPEQGLRCIIVGWQGGIRKKGGGPTATAQGGGSAPPLLPARGMARLDAAGSVADGGLPRILRPTSVRPNTVPGVGPFPPHARGGTLPTRSHSPDSSGGGRRSLSNFKNQLPTSDTPRGGGVTRGQICWKSMDWQKKPHLMEQTTKTTIYAALGLGGPLSASPGVRSQRGTPPPSGGGIHLDQWSPQEKCRTPRKQLSPPKYPGMWRCQVIGTNCWPCLPARLFGPFFQRRKGILP